MLDFDDMMAKKYGEDYVAEEHADEIFPDDTSVDSNNPQDDGQGEESSLGDKV